MTEFSEGPLESISVWKSGHGADVKLQQDGTKYFYNGNPEDLRKFLGRASRIETIDGTEDRKGQKEILDIGFILSNIAAPLPEKLPGPPPQNVQLPFKDLQTIMENKVTLKNSRIKALDAATRIYVALDRKEKDKDAAITEVVYIANVLEDYLVKRIG